MIVGEVDCELCHEQKEGEVGQASGEKSGEGHKFKVRYAVMRTI